MITAHFSAPVGFLTGCLKLVAFPYHSATTMLQNADAHCWLCGQRLFPKQLVFKPCECQQKWGNVRGVSFLLEGASKTYASREMCCNTKLFLWSKSISLFPCSWSLLLLSSKQSIDSHSVTFPTFESVNEVGLSDLSTSSHFLCVSLPHRVLCSCHYSLSVNFLQYFINVSDVIFIAVNISVHFL
jgi:hypothetical protein